MIMVCEKCGEIIYYDESKSDKIKELIIRIDEAKYYRYSNDIFNIRIYILEEELKLLMEKTNE